MGGIGAGSPGFTEDYRRYLELKRELEKLEERIKEVEKENEDTKRKSYI